MCSLSHVGVESSDICVLVLFACLIFIDGVAHRFLASQYQRTSLYGVLPRHHRNREASVHFEIQTRRLLFALDRRHLVWLKIRLQCWQKLTAVSLLLKLLLQIGYLALKYQRDIIWLDQMFVQFAQSLSFCCLLPELHFQNKLHLDRQKLHQICLVDPVLFQDRTAGSRVLSA